MVLEHCRPCNHRHGIARVCPDLIAPPATDGAYLNQIADCSHGSCAHISVSFDFGSGIAHSHTIPGDENDRDLLRLML
ncbi:hypothetical protein [Xanthomonas citri]|uniref:hypothetical protein n=1 Tax=Xanthomonas citri TaxID=346 RepID=UPI0021C1EFC4|nr:hypothetical protein [Xanthomonas citri]MCT8376720.1 hypothetical protein [Xanthomonas citri pv. anacardii]